jgi:hypothetical protein
VGDEIFIRRSGLDRPGIVLRGRITGFTKPMPTCTNGKQLGLYVQFQIEQLADRDRPPLVSDAKLLEIDADQSWRNQSSGISINPEAAANLRVLMMVDDAIEKVLATLSLIEQIATLTRLAVKKAAQLEQQLQ